MKDKLFIKEALIPKNTVELENKILEKDIIDDQLLTDCFQAVFVANSVIEIFNLKIKFLLKRNININSKIESKSLVHCAAYMGRNDMLETLIKNNAKIEERTECFKTPLHIAAEYRLPEVVKYLLENKANLEPTDSDHRTALHLAAANGNSQVVKCLLGNKAKLEVKDDYNKTPLYLAVQNNHFKTLKCLVEAGANTNIKAFLSSQPIHVASLNGNLDIVKYLIDSNVDLNTKSSLGKTPLHCAASQKNLSVVKFLLENKANINSKDVNDKTPIHLAISREMDEVFKFLLGSFSGKKEDHINYLNDLLRFTNCYYNTTKKKPLKMIEMAYHLIATGAEENILDKNFKNKILENFPRKRSAATNIYDEVEKIEVLGETVDEEQGP